MRVNSLTLNVILPVGISFYTFQTMSYTVDVYRKRLQPTHSLLDFAVFVAFFPQLVAGPIERAANLLPQFARPRHIRVEQVNAGLLLVLWGFYKKVVIADNCSFCREHGFRFQVVVLCLAIAPGADLSICEARFAHPDQAASFVSGPRVRLFSHLDFDIRRP
jgi:alginate O-acetyltransferase complex protein AlgI